MIGFFKPSWSFKPPRQWQSDAFDAIVDHYAKPDAENALGSAVMGSGKSILSAEICATADTKNHIVLSVPTENLVNQMLPDVSARCGSGRTVGVWYGKRKAFGQVMIVCNNSLESFAKARKRPVDLLIADEAHRTQAARYMRACLDHLEPGNVFGLSATPFRASKKDTLQLFKKSLFEFTIDDALKAGNILVPWKLYHNMIESEDTDSTCVDMIQERGLPIGPGVANAVSIDDAKAFAARLNRIGVKTKCVHSESDESTRKIMAELERGMLNCVVYVNMLSEGVNYPFLRWMLLRRKVSSRVRFIQEIGRLLRWSPGKDTAVYLDPFDQFSGFNISYREALGEPPPKKKPDGAGEEVDPDVALAGLNEPELPIAMAAAESLVRSLHKAAELCSMIRPSKKMKKEERMNEITPAQVSILGQFISRTNAEPFVPDNWKPLLETLQKRPETLRKGFAADLIETLDGALYHKRWPRIGAGGEIGVRYEREEDGQLLIPLKTDDAQRKAG